MSICGLLWTTLVLPGSTKLIIEIGQLQSPFTWWKKSIYAFVVGGEIKRIASSNYYLSDRFHKWNHDVTNALHGKKSDTPSWEAEEWRKCLQAHKGGEVYARVAWYAAVEILSKSTTG